MKRRSPGTDASAVFQFCSIGLCPIGTNELSPIIQEWVKAVVGDSFYSIVL